MARTALSRSSVSVVAGRQCLAEGKVLAVGRWWGPVVFWPLYWSSDELCTRVLQVEEQAVAERIAATTLVATVERLALSLPQ